MTARRDLHAPWRQPARALPIPVSPLPDELLISHVRRLAAANHTDPLLLIDHLGRRHQHPQARGVHHSDYDLSVNNAALDRLATYSGSPMTSLLAATRINPSTTADAAPHCQWIALTRHRLAHPCLRCTPSSPPGAALIALTEHQPGVCPRHNAILARPGLIDGEQPLTRFPDIWSASRQQQTLRRRRRQTFTAAISVATDLTQRWRRFGDNRHASPEHLILRWRTRAQLLRLPDDDHLVRYPETIALANLLSTMPWRPATDSRPAEPIVKAPVQFLARAAAYLNYPKPHELLKRGHPLCRWARPAEGPGYWWREYGPEPDRTAYFELTAKPSGP